MFKKKEIIKVEEVAAIEEKVRGLFNESSMHKTIVSNALEDLMNVNQTINEMLEDIEALKFRLEVAKEELFVVKKHNNKILGGVKMGLAEQTCNNNTVCSDVNVVSSEEEVVEEETTETEE
jgi:hypothetical protein